MGMNTNWIVCIKNQLHINVFWIQIFVHDMHFMSSFFKKNINCIIKSVNILFEHLFYAVIHKENEKSKKIIIIVLPKHFLVFSYKIL